MAGVIEIGEASFDVEVLESPKPVVVDFWAQWCGPCRLLAPVVKELATELEGKVRFAKLDVDANPGIAAKFGIQSIPTLLFFKGGRPVGQKVGAMSKEALRAAVEQIFGQ